MKTPALAIAALAILTPRAALADESPPSDLPQALVMCAGAALTGVGGGLLYASHLDGENAAKATDQVVVLELEEQQRKHRNQALLTGGAGLALIGAGVLWLWLRDDRDDRTSKKREARVVFGPTYVGLRGRF
jgi:hypothetical protein